MLELEAQLRAYGSVLDRAEAGVTDVVEPLPNRMRRSYVFAIAAAIVVVLAVSAIAVGTRRTGSSRVAQHRDAGLHAWRTRRRAPRRRWNPEFLRSATR